MSANVERGFEQEKLKGSENYHTWAYAIRELLALKGYEKYIESEVVDADGVTTGRAAKAVLSLSVEKKIFVHIQGCTSARKIWTTLQGLYEDKGLSRKIGLLRNLISTRLDTSENMQSYVDSIVTHSNKLNGIGFKLTDSRRDSSRRPDG